MLDSVCSEPCFRLIKSNLQRIEVFKVNILFVNLLVNWKSLQINTFISKRIYGWSKAVLVEINILLFLCVFGKYKSNQRMRATPFSKKVSGEKRLIAMKKMFLCSLLVGLIICCSCKRVICTYEFRMITLKVKDLAGMPVVLDSFYTVRQSNIQNIHSNQNPGPGLYTVLDDSYQPQLKNSEDNFRFLGWKNNQLVVNEPYRIGADMCHILRKTGADSVLVQ